jgi:hypothetical protein
MPLALAVSIGTAESIGVLNIDCLQQATILARIVRIINQKSHCL